MLSAKNINKSFGSNHVLKDVSLTANPGEIIVIIGPSGSGKSTLLRSIAMLDPPDNGTVIIDERKYSFPAKSNHAPEPPWPDLTIVFQQLFLWPHLTVYRNMELPLMEMESVARQSHINRLLNHYEINTFRDRYPNELSIGQRQRVAIARSVALNPRYLLLDEITSALDVESIEGVLQHLTELREKGMSIIIVTHLIGFARRTADRVLFMEDGRIVEEGPRILGSPKTDKLQKFLSLIEVSMNRKTDQTNHAEVDFITDGVLKYLRNKSGDITASVSGDEARYLDRIPYVEMLRSKITDDDLPWLMDALKNGEDGLAGLACSLLDKYVSSHREVRELFEEMWKVGSPYLNNRIMWRLLEFKDTAEAMHDEFVRFINAEWTSFRDFNLQFYSPDAVGDIMQRLVSKPAHKKWVYLYCVPEVVADPKEARKIIELGMYMDQPHMKEAAQAILKEYWPREDSDGPSRVEVPPEDASAGLAAKGILEILRETRKLDESIADQFNRRPLIDELRKHITDEDRDNWVLEGAAGDKVEHAGLCLSFLQKYDTQPAIIDFLRGHWENASPRIKAHLLWRILDDVNLPQDWHEKLFAFMLAHPLEFHSASLKFIGTPETVVQRVRERMQTAPYDGRPETKRWAYLCRVAGVAAQPEEAIEFLRHARENEELEFVRQVATSLLERFYPTAS